MAEGLATAAAAMSPWEAVAVVLAIGYLLLAIRQNIQCWVAAAASAAIYIVLLYQAGLYMESALQGFYIGMAVYGWLSWRHGSDRAGELHVTDWPLGFHCLPLCLIGLFTVSSGAILDTWTDAAFPYADSFTTWAAIVATWMVARKVIQNWHYWFVIDALSVYLFAARGLLLTAGLFLIYLVLIVVGLTAWRKSLVRDYERISGST